MLTTSFARLTVLDNSVQPAVADLIFEIVSSSSDLSRQARNDSEGERFWTKGMKSKTAGCKIVGRFNY